jgi:hypothetical protein
VGWATWLSPPVVRRCRLGVRGHRYDPCEGARPAKAGKARRQGEPQPRPRQPAWKSETARDGHPPDRVRGPVRRPAKGDAPWRPARFFGYDPVEPTWLPT